MFKEIKSETVVEAIFNQLTGYLADGTIKPGDRLPPEPELAAQLGVSRTALREALKMFSALGVLTSRRRGGTYVATSASPQMLNPLILSLIIDRGSKDEVFELRYIFELAAIELAIFKVDEVDVKRLSENLDDFEDAAASNDWERLHALDVQFHEIILDMSKNLPFIRIGRTVMRLFAHAMRHALSEIGTRQALDNHRTVFNCILAADLELARKSIKSAFEASRKYF